MGRVILLAAVVFVLALSGCDAPRGGGSVGFSGSLNATDGSFQMNGKVINAGYADHNHSNITVYLYTENKELITSQSVGSIDDGNVSIETETIPYYVIINSPDFWNYNRIDVDYYEYTGERFTQRVVGSKDEFPVRPPS